MALQQRRGDVFLDFDIASATSDRDIEWNKETTTSCYGAPVHTNNHHLLE